MAAGVTDMRIMFNFLFSKECSENVRRGKEGMIYGRRSVLWSWEFMFNQEDFTAGKRGWFTSRMSSEFCFSMVFISPSVTVPCNPSKEKINIMDLGDIGRICVPCSCLFIPPWRDSRW